MTVGDRRRALIAIAVVAIAVFGIAYLLGVHTGTGQRLDATALTGRTTLRPRAVHAAHRILATIDVVSVIVAGGAIVAVALFRRRFRLAVAVAVLFTGAVLTSEILKHLVLTRPDFGIHDALKSHNTFPSGHTTVAMSLAIGAMLVAPSRWRSRVAAISVLYPIGVGIAVIAMATHRPSDAFGAVLVVTIWTALVAAALLTVGPSGPRKEQYPWIGAYMAVGGSTLLVVGFASLLITWAAVRLSRLGTYQISGAFFGASAAIAGGVLLAWGALLLALQGSSLDAP